MPAAVQRKAVPRYTIQAPPFCAISQPAIIGPATAANWKNPDCHAIAFSKRVIGKSEGSSAPRAGALKLRTHPDARSSTKNTQIGAVAALVAASASATSPNPICVAARIFFRSPPSTIVPAGSVSAITGSARARPVAPRMNALSVRSQISHPIAVESIWSPVLDATNATAKNR